MNPDVIKAAASSTLGVLALMVLVISTIALAFFKDAAPKLKLFVFSMLFVGLAAFATAIVLQRHAAAPPVETQVQTPAATALQPGSSIPAPTVPASSPEIAAAAVPAQAVTATGEHGTAIGVVNGDVRTGSAPNP